MEMGVLSPESHKSVVPGILMEFPAATDDGAGVVISWSPPKMPSRLRRKMSEPKTFSPSSLEEIESKLQDATLRRQKYYEHLSSKARPKPRSPSHSSSSEEDRGQRLEAKLQAAEKKRLSLLAKSRTRLAKLDELRQAARNGVQMRFLKERAELGSKVELRVRQAETNRMLILKAYSQRRASLKERTSQSMLRRMARENKYKERVRAAISQKRAAAEKKRLGFLEAEKRKARARILQVQKVAMSMSDLREIERQKMQHKIEDRLQRAKKQREKYLMQRGISHTSSWDKLHQQGDDLSRKLARCWQQFRELKKTTLNLAQSYNSLNINQSSVMSMPFEQLALLIESVSALQTTKALLDRLETRYKISRAFVPTPDPSAWDDIDHLLKRVTSPKKRSTPRRTPGNRGSRKTSAGQSTRAPAKLSRYQVRVVLCAYMILGHPASVFSGRGERELALAQSAEKFVKEIELLITIILKGPQMISVEESDGSKVIRRKSFRSQLLAFDSAWCAYLNSFVLWKVKDAESLVEDLVRAACQLEVSMMHKCKITPEGDNSSLSHDLKAIQNQVTEDQRLLRQKVHHLSGDAGIERMESALSDTRSKYFQALDGSPVGGTPMTRILAPMTAKNAVSPASPCTSGTANSSMEATPRQSSVVRKLFTDHVDNNALGPRSSSHSSGERLDSENEFIVNESVHGDSIWSGSNNNQINSLEEKIKETMKQAFWDGIMESVEKDGPNFSRVYELMREVRDEICQMAPESWKQEIWEAIDMDILSQVLKSGNLDIPYFGKVLEFALVTLRKLSAPANEGDLMASHQKFLENLSETCQSDDSSKRSQYLALVRGLRFVLEQIQELKQDISRARIRLVEPLLKGPAGFDFLRKAFTNRYGSPDDSVTSLPLTKQWLLHVKDGKDQEWTEHTTILTELTQRIDRTSSNALTPITLKTGGVSSVGSNTVSATASTSPRGRVIEYPECKGELVDLLVRLGVIKLAFEITGLTEDGLPETLKLNIFRLRGVQERIQKIIVIATSILILRQTLVSEKIAGSHGNSVNDIVSKCAKQLLELLNSVNDAEIPHISELLSKVVVEIDSSVDTVKLQSIKGIMARMLAKSLQAGDAVFNRLSRVIYLGVRGVVLGGAGKFGREMAEKALRQVGAVDLMEEVVETASVLLVVAGVSVNVHGPWYEKLVETM